MAAEREVKLGASADFALPALDGVFDHVTAAAKAPRTLTAVYYDTPELRLARWGVTVRHRSGDGTGWTVKLPDGDDGPALVRKELTFEGKPERIPDGVVSLVRAYVRGGPFVPVAKLRTVRTAVDLLDGEGAAVAEVVDDEVSVLHGPEVTGHFREVEVEVGARVPDGLLDAVVARLRHAGAGAPDKTPKVVRALGARAQAPPEIVPVDLGKRATAADVVRQAIAAGVTRILQHDPGVRIGDDPEDVHQARVGTRRLRSDLRTFGPLLDEAWRDSVREELGWLADALGVVRDLDVLGERLRRQAATLPEPDTAGLAPLFRRLALERAGARAELLAVLESPRYVALLDTLVAAASGPPCLPAAQARATDVVPGLAVRPWRHLRSAVQALGSDPADADLHRVRILAKRARYAAEAAAPVAGKRAMAFASAVAHLQTVLGDQHDAVAAEAWLRHAFAVDPAPPGSAAAADGAASEAADGAAPDEEAPDVGELLAVGELIAIERAEAAAGRRAWPRAWRRASGKKLRSWM